MPYPYGYGGGNSADAFGTGLGNAQSFIDHIQNAYTQREAQARMDAKTKHDNAVTDAEMQLRINQAGGSPAGDPGSISGQVTQAPPQQAPQPIVPQAPADQIQTINGGLPMGPTDTTQMSGSLPAPIAQAIGSQPQQPYQGQSLAQNITGPQPQTAPQQQHMMVNYGGQTYQLPTEEEKTNAAVARMSRINLAQEKAKRDADAADLAQNGIPLGDLAKGMGLPPETMVTRDQYGRYYIDAHKAIDEDARQKQVALAQTAKEAFEKQKFDEEVRHNKATESNAGLRINLMGAGPELTPGQANVQKRADAKTLSDLEDQEAALNDQRRKMGVALTNQKFYVDDKGKVTPMSKYDDPQSMVDEMQSRFDASGDELNSIIKKKNDFITSLGGQPRVSTAQATSAINKGNTPQPAMSPAATPAAPAKAATPAATQPKIATQSDIAAFAKQNKIDPAEARDIFQKKGWAIAR